nr:lysylphosphatidylglycerol synthase transmembrane domain-containing protein [Ardenticatena sp.]
MQRKRDAIARIRSSWLHPVLWGLFTGVLGWATVQGIPWSAVWNAAQQANWFWLAVAVSSVLVNNGAKVWRWRALLGEEGERLGWGTLATGHLVGQLINTFVPGRAGEIGRLYLVGPTARGRSFVLGTIVLEKVLDLVALGVVFGVSVLLLPFPRWLEQPSVQAILVAVGVGGGLVAAIMGQQKLAQLLQMAGERLPERWWRWGQPRLFAMLESLQILRESRHASQVVVTTMVVWWTMVLNNYAVLRALRLPFGFDAALITMLVLLVGTSLIPVPGRIGVFEYLAMVGLGIFGTDAVQGVTFGVLLHAVVIGVPTVLALCLLVWYVAEQHRAGG